jgi:hypothetical protein
MNKKLDIGLFRENIFFLKNKVHFKILNQNFDFEEKLGLFEKDGEHF